MTGTEVQSTTLSYTISYNLPFRHLNFKGSAPGGSCRFSGTLEFTQILDGTFSISSIRVVVGDGFGHSFAFGRTVNFTGKVSGTNLTIDFPDSNIHVFMTLNYSLSAQNVRGHGVWALEGRGNKEEGVDAYFDVGVSQTSQVYDLGQLWRA